MDIYFREEDLYSKSDLTKISHKRLIELILEKAQKGDRIIFESIQNIANNTTQLCEVFKTIAENNYILVVGETSFDFRNCQDSETIGMLKIISAFDNLEHSVLSKSVKIGLAKARAKGKMVGRPTLKIEDIPKPVIENYELLEQGSLNKTDYAKLCNISRPTLNKYLEIMKKNR
ncbi:MAG: recombinase family protein [Aminipila sp.]